MSQDASTAEPAETDAAQDVHLKMFDGHDRGRERRMENGRYLADILYPDFAPKTVIDVGCGLGFFLAAMAEKGAKVTGVDNDWVRDLSTAIPLKNYLFHDLNTPFSQKKRFAMATSFEVAEHLEPARSEDFVTELCALSDVVAFSAAVPGQGGTGHINLRWQPYWANLFAERGYRCFDVIRPRIAAREDAFFWFRQNAFLFIKGNAKVPDAIRATEIAPKATAIVTRDFHKRRLRTAEKRIAALEKQLADRKRKAPMGE